MLYQAELHSPPLAILNYCAEKTEPAATMLLARQKGLEPLTRGLEGRCSVHLSYWRDRGEPI